MQVNYELMHFTSSCILRARPILRVCNFRRKSAFFGANEISLGANEISQRATEFAEKLDHFQEKHRKSAENRQKTPKKCRKSTFLAKKCRKSTFFRGSTGPNRGQVQKYRAQVAFTSSCIFMHASKMHAQLSKKVTRN